MGFGTGQITGTGNVTAGFFIGNGSQLTGITASQVSGIANGTSNVNINASGGNVTTSVGGTSNVLIVTSTGANIAGTLNTGSGNITTTGNLSAGNIIGATIINSTGNITTTGNIAVGNLVSGNIVGGTLVNTTANITTTANLVAGNIVGATIINTTGNATVGNVAAANVNANYTALANGVVSSRANVSVTSTPALIDSFSPSLFRVAKYVIMANATGANAGWQAAEVLLLQDGVNAYITIYGDLISNASPNADVIDITANINAGTVSLYAAANTTFGATAQVNVIPMYLKP